MAPPAVSGSSPGRSGMVTFARRFCQFCQRVDTWYHCSSPVAERIIASIARSTPSPS
jgi:hypothetical protein